MVAFAVQNADRARLPFSWRRHDSRLSLELYHRVLMETPTLIRSLDARYYTDEEVFHQERDGLLARSWQYAGHSSQLQKAGDYFTFEIAGENLCCVRLKDGSIRAYYNVCQHRAHELLRGAGNCKAIVCPYHAWTYDLNGQLRAGPNIDSVPGFDKSKISLVSVKLEDFHGFIFANLDPNAAPMDDWFPQVRSELLEFVPHIARLRPYTTKIFVEQCNWKVAIENYSECYHCKYNHSALATGVFRTDTYDIQPQGFCLRHTAKCQNLERMGYPVDLDSNSTAGKYSSWFLWPMFSFQVFPGNVLNTYCWRDVDVSQVRVLRGWYTLDGLESTVIRDLAALDHQTTVTEDIRIVESVQRGLKSRGYSPGPLVLDPEFGINSEHSIRTLQEWMIGDFRPQTCGVK